MELYGIGLVALIMGLSEVAKRSGFNSKFLPVFNIILGLGAAALTTTDIKQIIVTGIYMGLAASGLYSGAKNVNEGLRGN